MNRKFKLVLIGAFLASVGWLLASAPEAQSSLRDRWARVIKTEMVLAPKMTMTYQPAPYQRVQIILGAGEFALRGKDSFGARNTPGGTAGNFRIDISNPDFLIAASGSINNVGAWRSTSIHYIPWEKIVDICFDSSGPY